MTQYYSAAASRLDRRPDAAWRRNQNTVAFRVREGLGPVTNTVLVILLLSVLGLIYLTQITKTSSYGYQINELQQQREELQTKRASLQVESARLQALERVQQSDVARSMTAPQQTNFVN